MVFLPQVWPLPRSLATTYGISVDVSSSPYLDVSVQAVPSVYLFDSVYGTGVLLQWVSPFRNLRINAYLQLPAAYRSLSRLSSAPSAKAFALRPYSLDRFYGFPFRSRHSIFLILFRSCLLHPSQIHKVFTHSSASPEQKIIFKIFVPSFFTKI